MARRSAISASVLGERDAAVKMLTTPEFRARRRTLGADKAMTCPHLWPGSARATRRRMSPRTFMSGGRRAPSITGRRATSDMRSVKSNANWSKKASAGQDDWRSAQTASPRTHESELDFHLHERRVQPRADADTHPRRGMHVNKARSAVVVSHDDEFEPVKNRRQPAESHFPVPLSSNSSIFPQPALEDCGRRAIQARHMDSAAARRTLCSTETSQQRLQLFDSMKGIVELLPIVLGKRRAHRNLQEC